MTEVFVGLGGNLGDVEANMRGALGRLHESIQIDAVSSIYRSEPIGMREQPSFLNAVVRGRTHLSPAEVVERLLEIEADLGRVRGAPMGPRVIDLDLLLYGDRVVSQEGVAVPHPRMSERRFVLEPLVEIAPDAVHPVSGRSASELLAALSEDGWVERISGEDWPPTLL